MKISPSGSKIFVSLSKTTTKVTLMSQQYWTPFSSSDTMAYCGDLIKKERDKLLTECNFSSKMNESVTLDVCIMKWRNNILSVCNYKYFYCPPTKLWEGNVLNRACPFILFTVGPHITIIHDALDLNL